jgi:hypothetical protein
MGDFSIRMDGWRISPLGWADSGFLSELVPLGWTDGGFLSELVPLGWTDGGFPEATSGMAVP